ncbi:chorismate mutase [Candidatus Uhrbacteria bacterium]|nr:chorismate mutase [Candidatus Uhrbacteria bacterium]
MNITTLRQKIDATDRSIIKILAQRLRFSEAIGKEKKKGRLAVTDRLRELRMREDRCKLSLHLHLDPRWVEQVFRLIVKESKRIQKL